MLTQEEASEKYLRKEVRFTKKFKVFEEGSHGLITAFLINYESDNIHKVAIMGEGYEIGVNPCWYTLDLTDDELATLIDSIE